MIHKSYCFLRLRVYYLSIVSFWLRRKKERKRAKRFFAFAQWSTSAGSLSCRSFDWYTGDFIMLFLIVVSVLSWSSAWCTKTCKFLIYPILYRLWHLYISVQCTVARFATWLSVAPRAEPRHDTRCPAEWKSPQALQGTALFFGCQAQSHQLKIITFSWMNHHK